MKVLKSSVKVNNFKESVNRNVLEYSSRRNLQYLLKENIKRLINNGADDRWTKEGGELAHVIIMQHVNKKLLQQFLDDLKKNEMVTSRLLQARRLWLL